MTKAVKQAKNRRTIVVEDLENEGVRVTVAGPAHTVEAIDRPTSLSTRDISASWLTRFDPNGEERATYSGRHCTFGHDGGRCDGQCHEVNCFEPADFFVHWKGNASPAK